MTHGRFVRCAALSCLLATAACSGTKDDDDGAMPGGGSGGTTSSLAGGAAPPAGSAADSPPANSGAAGTAVGGSGGAANEGGRGGDSMDVEAGNGAEPEEPPCDPTAGGRTSSPGKYEGYSEPKYRGNQRSSFYVEVRDGTRLAMDLFRPTDDGGKLVEEPLPVLLMHTPYNRRTFTSGPTAETYPGFALRLVEYGYIVAVVDYRGLYASFGTNVAFNRGEWVDAARMDAYDVIEWLAEQPWSNGAIGMWGCSATGGSQLQAATTAPPHLKAVFPMSCEFDAYPFGVPGGMAPPSGVTKAPPGGVSPALRDATAAAVDGADGALLTQAIADHGSNIENPGYVPYRDSVAENIPEQWWRKSSPDAYLDMLRAAKIPMYLAANWNEAMTKYGAFFTFNNLDDTKMVIGPAGHCEWTNVKTQTGFDIVIEERRFFDHHLKGIDNCVMREPAVHYYTYNAPAGQEWQSAESWPLPNEKRTKYYLGDETLSAEAPAAAAAPDTATVQYNVTAQNRATKGLKYTTEPLAEDVQVTGHAVAELWIASSHTDGDFVLTIEDLAPDGTATSYMMEGKLRASHRALADAPYDNLGLPWHPFTEAALQPLTPGEPTLLTFDILPMSIVFAKGHRIRALVTFAEANTPVVTPAPTVTIYRDADHPSSITLPIIPKT